ncbi:MAG: RHS repeat-associated core domain-containing protein [Chloroflexota bacterium]
MRVGSTTVDTVTWRPDGLVASSANVDGNTNARTYDAAGRLTEIRLAAGGTTKADMDYTYNRAGLARTEATASINAAVNGTASFSYDHLGRLTNYDSPIASTADRDYAWSKVLNRTSVTTNPSGTPSTLTYTLDAADRITADSASGTYSADASGRMTARPSRQFVWDSLGRLTNVRDGSGATITSYTYDALDRVRSYTNSGTTWIHRYVGTTSSIALVRDNTAGTTERLLLNDLGGQPWGYLNASGTGRVSWLLNAHHDTVATFDSSGALGRYYRYTPDGAFAASGGSGATPTTRFQSSWYDGTTGLYWVVTRWYDPATARFLSEDSLLGEPANPDSRHRYAYGEGDPVNAWDPEGDWSRSTREWSAFRGNGWTWVGESDWNYGIGATQVGEVRAWVRVTLGERWVRVAVGSSVLFGPPVQSTFRIHCNQERATLLFFGKSCGTFTFRSHGRRRDWSSAPLGIPKRLVKLVEQGDYFLSFDVSWRTDIANPSQSSGSFYGWPERSPEFSCPANLQSGCHW